MFPCLLYTSGPELVALLAVAFGVGDQGGNKFQNIAFCLDIGQRIVVHGFWKVDTVEPVSYTHLDVYKRQKQ